MQLLLPKKIMRALIVAVDAELMIYGLALVYLRKE